ncbi:MAG: hypothetical protein DRP75_01960 [Candidatus Omnitrophota bacterium]|nr:MAG: hypothetical protein DRP75_01960 [Candidatus Omnitrophota bacterium]
MPGGNGTGPLGLGPMTGRAAGFCAGYAVPGYLNPIPNRRWFGRGRGWRHWYYATALPGWLRASYNLPSFAGWWNPASWWFPYEISPKQEAEILKNQAEFLKQQLKDVQSRVETLEKLQSQQGEKEE